MLLRSDAYPGFRIDGPTQMVVKIGAFGHAEQEMAKLQGIQLCGLQIKFDELFRRGGPIAGYRANRRLGAEHSGKGE